MPTTGVGTAHRGQDIIELIAGIWLFFTPFFVSRNAATIDVYTNALWDSVIVGALFMIVAILAMTRDRAAALEWVNVVLAIWLFVSPWVLGFAAFTTAAWTAWIVGVIVFCMALWGGAMAEPRDTTPPVTPGEGI
jgi:hypothetical protein